MNYLCSSVGTHGRQYQLSQSNQINRLLIFIGSKSNHKTIQVKYNVERPCSVIFATCEKETKATLMIVELFHWPTVFHLPRDSEKKY